MNNSIDSQRSRLVARLNRAELRLEKYGAEMSDVERRGVETCVRRLRDALLDFNDRVLDALARADVFRVSFPDPETGKRVVDRVIGHEG